MAASQPQVQPQNASPQQQQSQQQAQQVQQQAQQQQQQQQAQQVQQQVQQQQQSQQQPQIITLSNLSNLQQNFLPQQLQAIKMEGMQEGQQVQMVQANSQQGTPIKASFAQMQPHVINLQNLQGMPQQFIQVRLEFSYTSLLIHCEMETTRVTRSRRSHYAKSLESPSLR